jgi:hypothetical protein
MKSVEETGLEEINQILLKLCPYTVYNWFHKKLIFTDYIQES